MTDSPANADVIDNNVAIALRDVSFAYKKDAYIIRHASLDVTRGRVLAALGPNGSGKTTLLKLMAGVTQASSGSVSVYGRVAYVPQFVHVSFAYSVIDVVLMGRARHIGTFSTPSRRDVEVAKASLHRLGMAAFVNRAFDELSGGERQLITFARALAAESDILLLDEPTASLDLQHQQEALRWIHRLAHDDGLTVVFSTHQPQHADVVANDVVLLTGNGDVTAGSAQALLQPDSLSQLFGVRLRRQMDAGGNAGGGVLIPDFTL